MANYCRAVTKSPRGTKMYVVKLKNLVIYVIFKDIAMHTYIFSEEINFFKVKKVVKNLIEGVTIWTLVTQLFS
jgi:hypothetical protein